MEDNVVLLNVNGGIATITLNRPNVYNAMDLNLNTQLVNVLGKVSQDDSVRVAILTGAGKAFCAGGDLQYIEALENILEGRNYIANAGNIVTSIRRMNKPVIAMVNGVAAGAGFNLALSCDLIFCAQSARFGQSFVKVGLVPDCGGTYLLPRSVGLHKAKELMFTADLIDANMASRLGFINKVVDDSQLYDETYAFAKKISLSAPIAIGRIKTILNQSDRLTLESVLELEADSQAICLQTNDNKEGIKAFKEKRSPKFKGN